MNFYKSIFLRIFWMDFYKSIFGWIFIKVFLDGFL